MQKQIKILESYAQGGILTLELDNQAGKIGHRVDLEFDKVFIRGIIIKKLGKQLKIRISSIKEKPLK